MLNYTITGNGPEHLVLLHGFMENNTIWKDMEPHLSDKFTLIKIDLPGHGQSQVYEEIHTMEFMAGEVKKVLDSIDVAQFHLLGHSMGGYATLAFAALFPKLLKSITLFFSSYFADTAEKKEQREKSLRIIKEAFANYVSAGVPNLFNPNEKDHLEGKIETAKKIALSTDNSGVLAAVKGMIARENRQSVLADFEGKILVIAGKHDNAVDSDLVLQQLPQSTNIKSYLLDCGHNGHWEKPSICAEIINTELLHHLPKKLLF